MSKLVENAERLTGTIQIQIANCKDVIDIANNIELDTADLQKSVCTSLSSLVVSLNTVLITAIFDLENKNQPTVNQEPVATVFEGLSHTLSVDELDEEYEEENN